MGLFYGAAGFTVTHANRNGQSNIHKTRTKLSKYAMPFFQRQLVPGGHVLKFDWQEAMLSQLERAY
jgi:hypothetical protein